MITSILPGEALKQISGRDSANLWNTFAGYEEAGICYRNRLSPRHQHYTELWSNSRVLINFVTRT